MSRLMSGFSTGLIFIVFVQETTGASNCQYLQIATGLSNHAVQDQVLSPFIYKGLQAPLRVQYDYYGNLWLHTASIFYDHLYLTSPITNRKSHFSHYTDNTNGYAGYSLLRKVYLFEKHATEIYCGGRFKSYINYRNHYYTNRDQATTAEQSTGIDFHAAAYKNYNARNDMITCGIAIPLVSYVIMADMYNANVSEPAINLDPNKGLLGQFLSSGSFLFVNRLFEFESNLGIHRSLTNRFAIGAEHRLHYYAYKKHPDNRPTTYLNHQWLIDMKIKM